MTVLLSNEWLSLFAISLWAKQLLIQSVNFHFFSFCSEIEAKEACDWLRAAGFPQYAQFYEGK